MFLQYPYQTGHGVENNRSKTPFREDTKEQNGTLTVYYTTNSKKTRLLVGGHHPPIIHNFRPLRNSDLKDIEEI